MKSQREYIRTSSRCPCCDDSNVEGGFVEIDAGAAFQNVSCVNCGFSWTDNYKLIGFHYDRDDLPEIVHSPPPAKPVPFLGNDDDPDPAEAPPKVNP